MSLYQTLKNEATRLESGLLCRKRDVPDKNLVHVMIWKPRASKPCFNYLLKPEQVDKALHQVEQAFLKHTTLVAERRDKAKSACFDSVEVGTIFVCSWGYDQTNIDFYQVIEKKAKTIVVRKIGVKSEPAYSLASYVTPIKDLFLDSNHPYDQAYGKPMTKRLQAFEDGKIFFKPESFSIATIWDGNRRTETYTG